MTLQQVLTQVKQDLEGAGFKSFDYLPSRVNPPVAIVSPGQPFVEQGTTFTSFKVVLDVVLVAGRADNEKSTYQLYDLINAAIFNLGDWHIDTVQRPYQLDTGGVFYLATTVTISNDSIQITEKEA